MDLWVERLARGAPEEFTGACRCGVAGTIGKDSHSCLASPKIGTKNYNLYLVFGRFPAELGPETRSNGSGSKNNAERTENQPRKPIRMPFRDIFCSTIKTKI